MTILILSTYFIKYWGLFFFFQIPFFDCHYWVVENSAEDFTNALLLRSSQFWRQRGILVHLCERLRPELTLYFLTSWRLNEIRRPIKTSVNDSLG